MSVETNNGEPSLNQIWYPLFEANHLPDFSKIVLFWRIVLPILLNDWLLNWTFMSVIHL